MYVSCRLEPWSEGCVYHPAQGSEWRKRQWKGRSMHWRGMFPKQEWFLEEYYGSSVYANPFNPLIPFTNLQ